MREGHTPSSEVLRFARNLSPKLSSSDTLLPIDFDPLTSCVADRSGREYFLHWRPISLNPATVMATVPTWWDTDLRKLELAGSLFHRDLRHHQSAGGSKARQA